MLYNRFLVILIVLLSVACTPKTAAEKEYEDYLSRLENTLDVKRTPTPPLAKPTAYPSTTIEMERVTITLLDFLRLFGCDLQFTIGQRNNQMGKVAPASQQLLNALVFQQQAKACIDLQKRRDNETLANELAIAAEQKRLQIPTLIYNATLASDEFKSLWQYRIQTDYPENVSTELVSAIERLTTYSQAWLAGNYEIGLDDLESTLAVIRQGDAGTLWQALLLSEQQLSTANALIASRTGQRKLCLNGKPTPQSRIFETVVLKFFIQQIQLRQASINQRYHALFPAINAFENTLAEVMTPDYRAWQQVRLASTPRLLGAAKGHVAAIKQLVEQCGSSFGSES